MLGRNNYRDLPDEFAPPMKAATTIAKLRTPAEREAYFGRIPKPWHPIIRQMAIIGIAAEIVAINDLHARRRALAEVPEGWDVEVKQHVRRLWVYNETFGSAGA